MIYFEKTEVGRFVGVLFYVSFLSEDLYDELTRSLFKV